VKHRRVRPYTPEHGGKGCPLRLFAALATVAAAVAVAVIPSATASAVSGPPAGGGGGAPKHERMCRRGAAAQVTRGGQVYGIDNSVFGKKDRRQCLTLTGGTAYRISTSEAAGLGVDQVQASPLIFTGCWFGWCTPRTVFPVQVRRIRSTAITWDTRQRAAGTWNAALDEWFSSRKISPEPGRHANVAELMVWTRATMPHYQVGGRAGTELVTAAGHQWFLTTWRTGQATIPGGWAYIQFRLVHPSAHLTRLNLVPLIRLAERRHLISAGDWWQGDLATNEIWAGGRGLATTRFSSQVTLTRPKRKPKPVHVGRCHDGACRKGGRA
jgi:hypothetical protein